MFDSLFALVKRAPQLLPRALDVVSGLTNVSKEACASLVERGGIELLCDELRALGCRDDINTSGRCCAALRCSVLFTRHSVDYTRERRLVPSLLYATLHEELYCTTNEQVASSSATRRRRTSCGPRAARF